MLRFLSVSMLALCLVGCGKFLRTAADAGSEGLPGPDPRDWEIPGFPTEAPPPPTGVAPSPVAFPRRAFRPPVDLRLGTIYYAATDGFISISGRRDGRADLGKLQVNVQDPGSAAESRGHGYSYNKGESTAHGPYLWTFSLLVPIPKGKLYQILCDGGVACSGAGYVGEAILRFIAIETAEPESVFGPREILTIGKVYGPATHDGFIGAFGRLDGRTGQARVRIRTGTTSTSLSDIAFGYTYNNGTYLGSVQLTGYVRRGEYYQISCDGGSGCSSGGWLGDSSLYFLPVKRAIGETIFGPSQVVTLGPDYVAATDGILLISGRSDGVANSLNFVEVYQGISSPYETLSAWAFSYNFNVSDLSEYAGAPWWPVTNPAYLGTYQLTVPVVQVHSYAIACDGDSSCYGVSFIGDAILRFIPTSL